MATCSFPTCESTEPAKLADVLIHSLTHLYFRSPYAWLQEGVPSFMGSLWLEQNRGRDIAIQQLDNARGALSLAEPGDTATVDRQALLIARDPVYYRTKATYVFWMLRDLAGDEALGARPACVSTRIGYGGNRPSSRCSNGPAAKT